ncbi:MAG: macro domain-containing protein, partial [Armatimonadetes bacterium]|nr:macro domain-containing protein [Armatimonadota bacterium]
ALDAKYVIHAAVMGADLTTDAKIIARVTRSALKLADELSLRSIAFPALGTGVGGFDMRECAQITRQAVLEHIAGGTGLTLVEFVLFGEQPYKEFREVFISP